MKNSKRVNEGALIRINLKDGYDTFARLLANGQVAFYSIRCFHEEPIELNQIYESDILFVTAVMKYAFKKETWKIIDVRPLEKALSEPRNYFIKDILSGRFSIYRSNDGSIRDSLLKECQGLEEAAGWDPEHIEERLMDHFANRPNKWVEMMNAKLK
jgi:Immunity protein 26